MKWHAIYTLSRLCSDYTNNDIPLYKVMAHDYPFNFGLYTSRHPKNTLLSIVVD